MPVPEPIMVQHVVKIFPDGLVPGVHSTSLWTEERATTVDILQELVEKLALKEDPDSFDLVEVYSETGEFNEELQLRERSRTIQEFESPVRVQQDWKYKQGEGDKVGEYRIYLRQKTENLLSEKSQSLDIPITWMDGLSDDLMPEDFDPFYRQENEIDDLVDLPVLNEEILMENLQRRFKRGRIYTYVGGILIAINPFKYFPIYNPKYVLSYQHKRLGELPPHIFAIADIAYHRMLTDKANQCIVVSGESGSGKTESTKLVLHHLTALSHKTQASVLERTILAAGPVLEAFGNAKTCHNNNSSRFGKFTEITYRADGVVCGAVLREYLLEKSRIVAQAESERNYHVFYYLLEGANQCERQLLHLKEAKDYNYLNKSKCYTIDGVGESYEFLRLQQAMRNIGFSGEVQQRLFAVLSAVLHIGNVEFIQKERVEDAVDVCDNGVVDIVSDLLKVDKKTLIDAFTIRKTVARGEVFIRPYKKAEAVATRDGMAKALYGSVFDWIVLQINQTLKTRHNPRMSDVKAYSIGVLDIFGFEDFEVNSFEQFCINFANENLQFYLNQHIFQMRQDEYLSEGLIWERVEFVNNESCLNLINGRPIGLINLLDEECSLSMGTDDSLLAKFNQHHSDNLFYEKPPTKESAFSVIHYAGTVKYHIKGFKARNQDLMRNDIVASLKNSSDPTAVHHWSILRHMICATSLFKQAGLAHRNGQTFLKSNAEFGWTVSKSPTERKKINISIDKNASREKREVLRRATKVLNRADGFQRVDTKIMRERHRKKYHEIRNGMEAKRLSSYDTLEQFGHSGRGRSNKCPTVIGQFQNSLSELMDTLSKSHPFFVRCLRSNKNKAPMKFDADVVLRQLRYTGMLETVKIRQAGYPCRIAIVNVLSERALGGKSQNVIDFVKQYRPLLPHGDSTLSEEVPSCLKTLGLDPNHYQVGKNKVFMRESQYRILREKLNSKINNAARTIGWYMRAYLDRKRYLQTKKDIILIQATWRGYLVRKQCMLMKTAVSRIERAWIAYKIKIKKICLIQAHWKGYLARKKFRSLEDQRKRIVEENNYASYNDTSLETNWNGEWNASSCLSCACPIFIRRRKKFKVIVDVAYDTIRRTTINPTKYVKRSNSCRSNSLHENSFRIYGEVRNNRRCKEKKKAEAIVEDVLSDTTFSEQVKDRAGSLPPFKYVKNFSHHEYMEIPEPGNLVPDKALSTGFLDYKSKARIYEEIPDVLAQIRGAAPAVVKTDDYRASGVYDEIPCLPKSRSASAGSADSNVSSGKVTPTERVLSDTEKEKTTKKKAKDLLRRRSFSKLKTHSSPKKSLDSLTTSDVLVYPAKPQHGKEAVDLTSPVIEGKGSLLQIMKKMTKSKTLRRRDEAKAGHKVAESAMSSGGKEWAPTQKYVVQGDSDLEAFNEFLFKKLSEMNKYEQGTQETVADRLFKKALNQYHSSLLTNYANLSARHETIRLKYEEMSSVFVQILEKEAEKTEENLPTILGVNLFGSVVDEFVKQKSQTGKRRTIKHEKRSKKLKHEESTTMYGHKYVMTNFSIATYCEYCNSFIWDRGFLCRACKFTCHKKCSSKHTIACKGASPLNSKPTSIFGAKLADITNEENTIPNAIAGLMQEIETNGLFTEGIYRKPGLQTAVKSLKNAISSPDCSSVDFSECRVHVITSVLKLFFRQLAEPLVPRDFYDDFIRSVDLQNDSGIHARLCEVIQRFPKANADLFKRLINHLAQVAMHEEFNKMSKNGLAIVWAPCVIRSGEGIDSMEALQQLPMQTKCLEVLINTHVEKLKRNVSDIQLLGEAKVELIRESGEDNIPSERLREQIRSLDCERQRLTQNMSNLERANSRGELRMDSDDGLTSDDAMTDNDDSISFESTAPQLLLQDPPNKGRSLLLETSRRRSNGNQFSASSSFDDLSADLSDFNV
eukprot:gene308-938_t